MGVVDSLRGGDGIVGSHFGDTRRRTQRGIHRTPSQDMYFKGALFLHTLRGVVNDDDRWWKVIRDTYQEFKYRNILTEEMVRFKHLIEGGRPGRRC